MSKFVLVAVKRAISSVGHICKSWWVFKLKRTKCLNQETANPCEIFNIKDRILDIKERTWTLSSSDTVFFVCLFFSQLCYLIGMPMRT